jgi:alpha/beta superfamily hydrolase
MAEHLNGVADRQLLTGETDDLTIYAAYPCSQHPHAQRVLLAHAAGSYVFVICHGDKSSLNIRFLVSARTSNLAAVISIP